MESTESRLWQALDDCEVPFRLTRQRLINRFGYRNCGWSDEVYHCEPAVTAPLVKGMAHGMVFQFLDHTDMDTHPAKWFGYVRGNGVKGNLARAVDSLTTRFGKGQPEAFWNTRGMCWDFGFGRIVARVFPPELNTEFGPNERHDLIKGSAEECSITLTPAWREPLLAQEKTWVKTYRPMLRDQPAGAFPLVRDISADWPQHLRPPSCGFGVDTSAEALLHIPHPKLVNILPYHMIHHIECLSLLPARGPGQAEILVHYGMGGRDSTSQKILNIAQKANDPYALNDLAQTLATTLNLPLIETQTPNS